jgi:NADPH:quinone reductase-like Zn-dependent oxidoreductase
MYQAVMTRPGNIEFRNIARPVIQADEVLIKVERIGV